MKTLMIIIFYVTCVPSLLCVEKETDIGKLDRNMKVEKVEEKGIRWYSPETSPFRLLGFKWFGQDKSFRRLPLKSSISIPPKVDILANHTSGGQIHFKTTSRRILIRVKLKASRPMYHMTQVAKQGFDLYTGSNNNKVFVASTKFHHNAKEYTSSLYRNTSGKLTEYTINFPLYSAVEKVEIGLDTKAKVVAPSPLSSEGSIVIYGTSITQGGCASRPGMSYTNILSRRLDSEVVNLGFSGSGKGEPEVAQLISQISKKSLIVLDFECNTHEQLREVLKPFIETLRKKDAETPILVASRIPLARDQNPSNLEKRLSLRDFQKKLVEQFSEKGDQNIYFVDGASLFNSKWGQEATVDGTHATDLGFLMMAEALEPHIKNILSSSLSKE
ncbi:MAG: SGNH/GDSL hydrolase family protein [Lentisphaeraceae bacterium]|nr:SGNH/GDSL hydrolase family protein [Lentisphaeraceae bacterium]